MLARNIANPYPVKVFHPILEDSLFRELRAEFPSPQDMPLMGGVGYKRSISDGKRGGWDEMLQGRPAWASFYRDLIKTGVLLEFAKSQFDVLNVAGDIKQRVELSLMPSDGGNIEPHPDTAKKLVTLVIYLADDDWKPEWGGAFSMVIPQVKVDPKKGYPRIGFGDVTLAQEIPFRPNTAVFMERSERSFHAVYPLTAPAGRDRRSITVNFIGRATA
jgi:hypothetical protein